MTALPTLQNSAKPKCRPLACSVWPARVKLAFRLDADEWQGVRRVRFLVEGAQV